MGGDGANMGDQEGREAGDSAGEGGDRNEPTKIFVTPVDTRERAETLSRKLDNLQGGSGEKTTRGGGNDSKSPERVEEEQLRWSGTREAVQNRGACRGNSESISRAGGGWGRRRAALCEL